MKRPRTALALLAVWAAVAAPATAADESAACRNLDDDGSRLACYDRAAGRVAPLSVAPTPVTGSATPAAGASASAVPAAAKRDWWTPGTYVPQTFAERWELEPATKDGVFKIKAYQPTYVLIGNWRKNTNPNPCSPNPLNCASGQGDYMHGDAKFQISAKTKLWEDIFGTPIDLWAAYTQQSYWQVYDGKTSRPFRETDFQPEAWVTVPLSVGPEWLRWRMLNLGLSHQSNGQSDPLSRSWNRVYATFGLTSGDLSVLIKPWWRVPETGNTDNNADVGDYAGRLEVQAVLPYGANVFSATVRSNLKNSSSTPNRTSLQADWAFPLYGQLHGYVQGFSGWNDSLQNYNFRNSGIGIGISLTGWR
ncbi:MAG: phospholipase A [Burkholderiaceae bacterium]|nr:phospholipase A [Burkholderiaceae bacterium]